MQSQRIAFFVRLISGGLENSILLAAHFYTLFSSVPESQRSERVHFGSVNLFPLARREVRLTDLKDELLIEYIMGPKGRGSDVLVSDRED